MNSPAFSNFRQWMDLWDEQEGIMKVKSILENNGLVLFFQKGKEIYGAPESSRVTFAKMKNPEDEEDMPDGWEDEANFAAFDLLKALMGQRIQVIFNKKDMNGLKILDQDAVEKLLSKKGGKKGIPDVEDDDGGDPAAPEKQPQIHKVDEK